jgi:hypothetical protein
MKRQSYLQQVAPGAPARRRDGVNVLTPPRHVVRASSRSVDPFELETVLVTARAPAPHAQAAAKASAAGIVRTDAESQPPPSAAQDAALRRGVAMESQPPRVPSPEPAQDTDASSQRRPLASERWSRRAPTPEGGEAVLTPTAVPRAANAPAAPGSTRDAMPRGESQPVPHEANARPNPPHAPGPQYQSAAPIQQPVVQPAYSRPPAQDKPRAATPGDALSNARAAASAQLAADRALRPAIPAARSPPPREPARASLHIGTLEVRVTAPAPAPVAAAPRPAAPRQSARSGGAGGRRIARGFGVFGLEQS